MKWAIITVVVIVIIIVVVVFNRAIPLGNITKCWLSTVNRLK